MLASCWPLAGLLLAPCWLLLASLASCRPLLASCWPLAGLAGLLLASCWPLAGSLLALAGFFGLLLPKLVNSLHENAPLPGLLLWPLLPASQTISGSSRASKTISKHFVASQTISGFLLASCWLLATGASGGLYKFLSKRLLEFC